MSCSYRQSQVGKFSGLAIEFDMIPIQENQCGNGSRAFVPVSKGVIFDDVEKMVLHPNLWVKNVV